MYRNQIVNHLGDKSKGLNNYFISVVYEICILNMHRIRESFRYSKTELSSIFNTRKKTVTVCFPCYFTEKQKNSAARIQYKLQKKKKISRRAVDL